MIVKNFDFGWGPEWELKKFETSVVSEYLLPLKNSRDIAVTINSTWYTDDDHKRVLSELETIKPNLIVLIAMLDSAIPKPDWFAATGIKTIGLGYYSGNHYVDWWSLVVDRYMDLHAYDLDNVSGIDTAFMSLNRKPHWHRRKLFRALESFGLLDQGIVSMGGDEEHPVQRVLDNDHNSTDIAPNPGTGTHGIANDIASLGNVTNWQRHFLNIVTETMWNIDDHRFVSEKIFKPIVGQRPFLVYDVNGAGNWLAEHGFESYVNDFTDICQLDLANPDNIPMFLKILAKQGTKYYQAKYLELQEKIVYNKSMFANHVANQKNKVNKGIPWPI